MTGATVTAREVWHLLIHPKPVPDISDLRPLRVSKAITLEQSGGHFHTWPTAISRLERGQLRDDDLAHDYRDWLTSQPDSMPSKRMLTLHSR